MYRLYELPNLQSLYNSGEICEIFSSFSSFLLFFQPTVFYWYFKNLFIVYEGCMGHPEITFLSSIPLQKLKILLRGKDFPAQHSSTSVDAVACQPGTPDKHSLPKNEIKK
jgi:hypothetical protein